MTVLCCGAWGLLTFELTLSARHIYSPVAGREGLIMVLGVYNRAHAGWSCQETFTGGLSFSFSDPLAAPFRRVSQHGALRERGACMHER